MDVHEERFSSKVCQSNFSPHVGSNEINGHEVRTLSIDP